MLLFQTPETAGELAKQLGLAFAIGVLAIDRIFPFLPKRKENGNGNGNNIDRRLTVLETEHIGIKEDIEEFKKISREVDKLLGRIDERFGGFRK